DRPPRQGTHWKETTGSVLRRTVRGTRGGRDRRLRAVVLVAVALRRYAGVPLEHPEHVPAAERGRAVRQVLVLRPGPDPPLVLETLPAVLRPHPGRLGVRGERVPLRL